MRFIATVPLVALYLASAVLVEPVAGSRIKGRGSVAKPLQEIAEVDESEDDNRAQPPKRRLNGKGKGSSSDDFYKYPCKFCGQGNNSTVECFSKDMSVVVMGQGMVKMDQLQVGDKVLTDNGVFQSVYSFAHRDPYQKAEFLKIYSDNAQPLEVTQDHLVYLADRKNPVRANSVRVGDVLKTAAGSGMVSTILEIETVQKKGIYAPLTLGGSLVVQGVLASSYISVQHTAETENISQSSITDEYMVIQRSKVQIPIISHQQYVDMVISPYRLYCRAAGNSACDATKATRDGMPLYVRLGLALTRLMSAPTTKFHSLFIVVTILLSSPFWLLEKAIFLEHDVMNFSYLAAMLLTTLTWMALKKCRIRFVAQKMKTA